MSNQANNSSRTGDHHAAPDAAANTGASRSTDHGQPQAQVHAASGYTWYRDEDAPGHAWRSKKGQEEMLKARELVSEPDLVIGDTYGDPALIAPAATPWESIR